MLFFCKKTENQDQTEPANPVKQIRLFDGLSFDGWEGVNKYFKIRHGAIVGGSLDTLVDKSYYLCTQKRYRNFRLKLKVKIN